MKPVQFESMKVCRLLVLIGLMGMIGLPGLAQAEAPLEVNEPHISLEVLSAKALLEDLLVRRYSQELATLVDRQAASVSAQVDLTPIAPPSSTGAEEQEELPPDLLLGVLDPEALIKKYAPSENRSSSYGFLKNYGMSSVSISVGLKEDMPPAMKVRVEKWLKNRLNSEFGKMGKGAVTFIKSPPPPELKLENKKPEKNPDSTTDKNPEKSPEKSGDKTAEKKESPKTLWDWMSQLQTLFGQLALAFAIILSTLLWALFGSKRSESNDSDVNVSGQPSSYPPSPPLAPESEMGLDSGKPKKVKTETEETEKASATREIHSLSQRLLSLAPDFSKDCADVLRSWCQSGEEGKLKLVCFVEAVGTKVGHLPIPEDAARDLASAFQKMPELDVRRKCEALRKVYWDVLMAMNLGAKTLVQPFGYLSGMKTGMLNQVLMNQNPKMKTLVTLYMPPELRESYLRSLDETKKRELLQSAAQLSEISNDELTSFDRKLKGEISPSGENDLVQLDSYLKKLIEGLTPVEQITFLPSMEGAAIERLMRTTPSLAFLDRWPDRPLSHLLAEVSADEVVAFLRVRPDLTDRILSLCPPMTSEMAVEDLGQSVSWNEEDQFHSLELFLSRMKDLIQKGEVNLESIFDSDPSSQSGQVTDGIGFQNAA